MMPRCIYCGFEVGTGMTCCGVQYNHNGTYNIPMARVPEAKVRELMLERLVRDCLEHIDLLEGHLPMANAEDEAVYKQSLMFGERVSCLLSLPPNPSDQRADAQKDSNEH